METLKVGDLQRFKEWLADACITPEALEWVRGFTDEQVEEVVHHLAQNGVAFEKGVPVSDPYAANENSFWRILEEALAGIETPLTEQKGPSLS